MKLIKKIVIIISIVITISCLGKAENKDSDITNLAVNIVQNQQLYSDNADKVISSFYYNMYPFLKYGNSPLGSNKTNQYIDTYIVGLSYMVEDWDKDYINYDLSSANSRNLEFVNSIFLDKFKELDIDFSNTDWTKNDKKVTEFLEKTREALYEHFGVNK